MLFSLDLYPSSQYSHYPENLFSESGLPYFYMYISFWKAISDDYRIFLFQNLIYLFLFHRI